MLAREAFRLGAEVPQTVRGVKYIPRIGCGLVIGLVLLNIGWWAIATLLAWHQPWYVYVLLVLALPTIWKLVQWWNVLTNDGTGNHM